MRIKLVAHVSFISQLMSSRVYVGLEFLSTHANIYESTHAHYDGKTKFVYRTKPKSYFCWSAFSVSS